MSDGPPDSGQHKGSFFTTLPGILSGVAAILTAVGGILAIVVTRDGDAATRTTTTVVDSAIPTGPTEPEPVGIVRHVPAAFSETCEPLEDPPVGAPDSVNCSPRAGASFVQYRQYGNADQMNAAYDSEVEAARTLGAEIGGGECSSETTNNDTVWEDADGNELGRLLCYTAGQAEIVWAGAGLN